MTEHAHPRHHDDPPSHDGPYAIAHSHAICPTCGSDDPALRLDAVYNFGWYGKGRGQCMNTTFHTSSEPMKEV